MVRSCIARLCLAHTPILYGRHSYKLVYAYLQGSVNYQLTSRKSNPRFLAVKSLIECTVASIQQVTSYIARAHRKCSDV